MHFADELDNASPAGAPLSSSPPQRAQVESTDSLFTPPRSQKRKSAERRTRPTTKSHAQFSPYTQLQSLGRSQSPRSVKKEKDNSSSQFFLHRTVESYPTARKCPACTTLREQRLALFPSPSPPRSPSKSTPKKSPRTAGSASRSRNSAQKHRLSTSAILDSSSKPFGADMQPARRTLDFSGPALDSQAAAALAEALREQILLERRLESAKIDLALKPDFSLQDSFAFVDRDRRDRFDAHALREALHGLRIFSSLEEA